MATVALAAPSPGGSRGCEVVAPRELDVFYASSVPVEIRPARATPGLPGPEAVQVVVDGVSAAEVDCAAPRSFVLNNLAAGGHTLALLPAGRGATRFSAKNISFFVSADLFWQGQASPTQLHAAARQCQGASGEPVCDRRGGGGPRFWVIMTGYNAARWVDKAISSLRRQRYCNFMCVLVDDASTDSTLEVAREAICQDQRFLIIANRERQGAAYNQVCQLCGVCV